MELIREIRRKNGFNLQILDGGNTDYEVTSFRDAIQENLQQALKNLSKELYSKSTHFILEFIQNADDNIYATNVIPTLKICVSDKEMSFHCNEVGFDAKNAEAICKVGVSTKKGMNGYIGEKGIGFKSVFTVADAVFISSGPYTFKLDEREKLGMITPEWDATHPVSDGWTSFYLQLSRNGEDLADHMNEIDPSILLFLRKLRSLTIEVALSTAPNRTIEFHHIETDDKDLVVLEHNFNGQRRNYRYFLVKNTIRAYEQEPKRQNVKTTEIVLAFPIKENGVPVIGVQKVHAFLPLRNCGFSFIIQADFLTSANREDVLSDLQWNTFLRNGVVETFLMAVERFKRSPTLEYVWFRFLPKNIPDAFFRALERDIKRILRHRSIFRSTDGTYRLPSEVVIVPAGFCDEGQPLIPERVLPGVYYLSTSYDISADGARLRALGVCDMSDEQFIDGLKKMESWFILQSDAWHEAVCQALSGIMRVAEHSIEAKIRNLRLLPLSNGKWISSGKDVLFDCKLVGIPGDLGFRNLKAGIKKQTSRFRLFQELGVNPAGPTVIVKEILSCHGNRSYGLESLICHARFVFAHRNLYWSPVSTLQIMDEDEVTAVGNELYMDVPESQGVKMCNVLQSPARFIHPKFLAGDTTWETEKRQQWLQWLQDALGVNVHPRLIFGDLSPEFVNMAQTLESRQFLVVLKESWPHLTAKLSQKAISNLARTVVACEGGRSRTICTAYIKTKSLKVIDLPFLPIDDPDDPGWDFLRTFGVSSELNGTFYIKRLVQLQKDNCEDKTVIEGIYKQLEARFDDGPDSIREAFLKRPLVFTAGEKRWIYLSQAIWDGPPSVKSKFQLKAIYPRLDDLFVKRLGLVPSPHQDLLVNELEFLIKDYKEPISETAKDRIFCVLLDLSELLSGDLRCGSEWLEKLRNAPIFPVDSPETRGVVLCKASDLFYIADQDLYKTFLGHLPLLSLGEIPLDSIRVLLDSWVFKSAVYYLANAIDRTSTESGDRSPVDDAFTNNYVVKIPYIERMIRHVQQSDCSSDVQSHLANMSNVKIFRVASIQSTYKLDDVEISQKSDVAIEEKSNELIILISEEYPRNKWDNPICVELAKLLQIPKGKLWSIITQSIERVEEWFELEGVPPVYPDHSADDSRPEDARSASHCLGSPLSDCDPVELEKKFCEAISQLPFTPGLLRASRQPLFESVSSFPRSPGSPQPLDPTQSLFARLLEQVTMEQLDHWRRHFNRWGSGSVTPYQQINGILGEYIVYIQFLLSELPDFGPDNWTSELRGLVRGFTPFAGTDAIADFTYHDCKGKFTQLWYNDKHQAWKDRWPTYHVEVKSTSLSCSAPFHMSQRQLNHALDHTMRDSEIPKDVYVLVRVCDVRTPNLSSTLYIDPHPMTGVSRSRPMLSWSLRIRHLDDESFAIVTGSYDYDYIHCPKEVHLVQS